MGPNINILVDIGISQRIRISRALSTILALSLLQVVAAPIVLPTFSTQAQGATLSGNLNSFVQYNDWLTNYATIGNHRPYINQTTDLVSSNDHEIKLVPNVGGKTGFLWNETALTGDLVVSAQYWFGDNEVGADGSYFKLMPKSNWPNGGSNGAVGTNATRGGVSNSVFVHFDTYQNSPDRIDDHVSAWQWKGNGEFEHKDETGILLKDNSGNDITQLEGTGWKDFTIKWTMSTKTLDLYSGALNSTQHLIKSWTFTGQTATEYYWGWTGETGGASNDHSVRSVNYHISPTATMNSSSQTVQDGAQVSLNASFTSSETSPTKRWEYSTDGGSSWISSGITDSTYTFTASRALTQRQYRFYVESTAVGTSYSKASNAITLTVLPPALLSETDTALSFNAANQYAKIDGTILPTASSSPFTLEAWIYPTDAGTNDVIFSQGTGSTRFYVKRANRSLIYYRDGFNTTTSEITCGGIDENSWSHIAITWNGSNETNCYINATLVRTSNSALSSIKTLNGPAFIGQYSADPTVPASTAFAGQIDEVKIWSAVRDQSQILSSAHSRADTTNANLLAYYDFNEGASSNIYNRKIDSTSSSDFVIQNSATWVSDSITATTINGPYTVQRFLRSYLTTNSGWKVPAGVSKVTALVVAGGGGAGFNSGGGGSGGGVSYQGSLSTSGNIAITVGMGGRGATSNGTATAGTSSTFGATNAAGGNGGVGPSGAGGSSVSGSGAGGAGSATSSAAGGNGGNGPSYSITGVSVNYAGGGGGGGWIASSVGGTGGSGGGAAGGGGGASSRTGANNNNGASGTPNTGGGGGGGSVSSATSGNGGSGIIIIRWITATAPIFTGPASDTLTAGMVETFTVSGSPISPLTRNYRWQVSTDTGTSWVNATTGTGLTSANYTTPTLETTTSGIRYQYRVVVTDSDTAGLFIVETSTATVFLTINPRITITGSSVSLTQKYGETQTVTYTIANGTGTRTTVASPNNRTGITWSSVSGSAATLGIGAGLGFGTYYETLTVTDSVTATTTQMVTISISKADTITVTLDTITALTYTGTNALVNPKMNISGLKSTDSATAEFDYTGTTLTYNVSSGTRTCAQGGTCSIGDSAPGGGKVFYVSGTSINNAEGISSGGIYLATAPNDWATLNGDPNFYYQFGCSNMNISGNYVDAIGSGASNTKLLAALACGSTNGGLTVANASINGYSDWFMPSAEELKIMRTNLYVPGLATRISTNAGLWSSVPESGSLYNSYYMTSGGTVSPLGRTSSKNQGVYIMPIRAFSPIPSSGSSAPTNAGSYTVLPVNFAMTAPATLANYQGATITGRNFTIDKAYQAKLSIGQYDAFPGISSYPLNVYGGSGSGTLTRTLVDTGTANCALSGTLILSASNVGTCTVRAVKDGGINYFTETTTAIIYWMNFINRYTSSGPTTPTDLGISGSTGFEKRTYETFTVLSFANGSGSAVTSAAKGSVMRVIGTGFNSSDETTEVIIGFLSIPKSSLTFNTTNPLANYVEFTLPNSSDLDAGANDVAMKSRKGWAFAPGLLNVTG